MNGTDTHILERKGFVVFMIQESVECFVTSSWLVLYKIKIMNSEELPCLKSIPSRYLSSLDDEYSIDECFANYFHLNSLL